MSTKANPGEFNCFEEAEPDEEMFVLLGRDRHASALVRLWAEMREREGEDLIVVAEARECADRLERYAQGMGRPVMNMDSLVMFATTLRQDKEEAATAPPPTVEAAPGSALEAGEIVMVGHGGPAKLVRILADDPENEAVRGKVNVQFPRSGGPVTVDIIQLRRASAEEREQYRLAGGRF